MEVSRRESFSDTDEPSLESRVADNLKGGFAIGGLVVAVLRIWVVVSRFGALLCLVARLTLLSLVARTLGVSDTSSEVDGARRLAVAMEVIGCSCVGRDRGQQDGR